MGREGRRRERFRDEDARTRLSRRLAGLYVENRQLAAVAGVSDMTVGRARRTASTNVAPEPDSEPARVIGADGKSYPGRVAVVTRPLRWTAAEDRVAHAHRPGSMRVACGIGGIAERFARPARSRCQACLAALEPPSRVACRAFMSHAAHHRRVGGRFASCDACHPPAAQPALAL